MNNEINKLTIISQNISIENEKTDYDLTVFKCNDSYEIVISDDKENWICVFSDLSQLNRLKYALRKKDGMKYSIKKISNTLKMIINHDLFEVNDEYEFDLCIEESNNEAKMKQIMKRMQELDLVPQKTHFITSSMMKCHNNELFPDLQELKNHIAFYISAQSTDKALLNQNKPNFEINMRLLNMNYKFSYIHSDERPVPTKNSIVFDGVIKVDERSVNLTKLTDIYTLITRITPRENIMGTIKKYPGFIELEFYRDNLFHTIYYESAKDFNVRRRLDIPKNRSKCSVKKAAVRKETQTQHVSSTHHTIPLDKFYNLYMFKLPFDVLDGVYQSQNNHGTSQFVLIRNNQIYHEIFDLNLENQTATCNKGNRFVFGNKLTIYLD